MGRLLGAFCLNFQGLAVIPAADARPGVGELSRSLELEASCT